MQDGAWDWRASAGDIRRGDVHGDTLLDRDGYPLRYIQRFEASGKWLFYMWIHDGETMHDALSRAERLYRSSERCEIPPVVSVEAEMLALERERERRRIARESFCYNGKPMSSVQLVFK